MNLREEFEQKTGEQAIISYEFISESVSGYSDIGHYEPYLYNKKYVKWLENKFNYEKI